MFTCAWHVDTMIRCEVTAKKNGWLRAKTKQQYWYILEEVKCARNRMAAAVRECQFAAANRADRTDESGLLTTCEIHRHLLDLNKGWSSLAQPCVITFYRFPC